MATVQSIIDSVTFVTKDPERVRFGFEEILQYVRDAQQVISTTHPRASSSYEVLTLAAGSRQDLRLIDPDLRWRRLFSVEYNVVGLAAGPTVRQISRTSLDRFNRNWRSATPQPMVDEFAVDEREPYTFDVNPPVTNGTKVMALVAIVPPVIEDEDSDFGLAEGYEIPAADYVLSRLFAKDASDASYAARSAAHMQAFATGMAMRVRDAGAA